MNGRESKERDYKEPMTRTRNLKIDALDPTNVAIGLVGHLTGNPLPLTAPRPYRPTPFHWRFYSNDLDGVTCRLVALCVEYRFRFNAYARCQRISLYQMFASYTQQSSLTIRVIDIKDLCDPHTNVQTYIHTQTHVYIYM